MYAGEEVQPEDQLLPLTDIPLTLASVTKYQKGTAILRYIDVYILCMHTASLVITYKS